MTSNDNHNKRCVIKKLDFENCIVTGIRSKTRGKRKLRARVTLEIETFSGSPKKKLRASESPQKDSSRETSPVLITKQAKGNTSPVLLKKNSVKSEEQNLPLCFHSTQTSPVFKVTLPKLRNFSQSDHTKLTIDRASSADIFSYDTTLSFSRFRNHCAAQESQDSRLSIQTSSLESTKIKIKSPENDSIEIKSPENYSIEIKSDSLSKVLKSSCITSNSGSKRYLPEEKEDCDEILPVLKKNYKKKSLLGRLQKALKKNASEKLLWQHQRQKNITFDSQKLTVIRFWIQESNFFLECQPLGEDHEVAYFIIDSKWVPNIKKVKEGSSIQLHPPWQKLCIGGRNVFLNIICLEILDEVSKLPKQKVSLKSVPTKLYDSDQNLLIDSLFYNCNAGFLF